MTRLALATLGTTALLLAACGTSSPDDDAADTAQGVSVVATTTMLGDVVAQVTACAGGSTTTLMPVGADPHDFSPSSEQVASIVAADLVVANGLGLEEGLADAIESAEVDGATVLEVAELVDPIEFGGHGHADEEEHSGEEEHGDLDPHFWHDAMRMATAAQLVGDALAAATGDDTFSECGQQVADDLRGTDAEVREILSRLDDDQRVLVTDHDALGYFAEAYGFEVAGVVIPGGATLAEPSSQELADLVQVITQEEVPAIFSNTAAPSDLTDAVAAEAGATVEVVELYVGSLGPQGSGAQTYAGMMLANAQRIADALSGPSA
jgi:zinc/manganese transport system substrate-binding protein